MDLPLCRTCNTRHRLGAQHCPALKSRGGSDQGRPVQSQAKVGSDRPADAGAAPSPREFKRPLAKDAAKTISRQQPWLKEGMSRASWYRRLSEQRSKGEGK